jgi:signal transduction histidine kinase
MAERLPADTELALYRILQEALKNVEKHARARSVAVRLRRLFGSIQLVIHDDGIGFDPDVPPVKKKEQAGFGLLGMRERASYLGGVLHVTSRRRSGTTIEARLPVGAKTAGSLAH